LLAKYDILLANIDGKKVNTYSILNRKLTNYELFDCIVNQNEMGTLLQNPSIKFGANKNAAAARVQSLFKMIVVRKDFGRIKVLIKKVIYIQE